MSQGPVVKSARRGQTATTSAAQSRSALRGRYLKRMDGRWHLLPHNVEFSGGAPLHGAASAGT